MDNRTFISAMAGAALSLFVHISAVAQPSQEALSGEWLGELDAGSVKMPLVLNLGETVSLGSPSQGPGVIAGTLRIEGDRIIVTFPANNAGFEGRLEADNRLLVGTFSQNGLRFPIAFGRGAAPVQPALSRPQTPRPPFPYREEEVAYDNPKAPGVRLAGTLTLPQGPGPFPAALLITGSGQQDRDENIFGHKPFLVLADHLTRRGIAVLRVDDRGVGGSVGPVVSATSADLATDVEAGIAFLRERKDIDAERVGLIGHSEGGIIAPMVAATDPQIAFLVLLAAPGVSGAEVLVLQQRLMNEAAGLPAAFVAASSQRQQAIVSAAADAADDASARAQVQAILTAAGTPEDQAAAQARTITTPWFRYFFKYDPAPALTAVQAPVLALIGGKDLQVPASQNIAPIREALAGNPRAVVDELRGLNHLFQTATTGAASEYGEIEETIAPAALERIGDWVEEVVRR